MRAEAAEARAQTVSSQLSREKTDRTNIKIDNDRYTSRTFKDNSNIFKHIQTEFSNIAMELLWNMAEFEVLAFELPEPYGFVVYSSSAVGCP